MKNAALAKKLRNEIGRLQEVRYRLAQIDVPEENEHLQGYAQDGVCSAIGYLETLARRAEGRDD